MLQVTSQLPSREGLREFVITREVVRGEVDLLAQKRARRDTA